MALRTIVAASYRYLRADRAPSIAVVAPQVRLLGDPNAVHGDKATRALLQPVGGRRITGNLVALVRLARCCIGPASIDVRIVGANKSVLGQADLLGDQHPLQVRILADLHLAQHPAVVEHTARACNLPHIQLGQIQGSQAPAALEPRARAVRRYAWTHHSASGGPAVGGRGAPTVALARRTTAAADADDLIATRLRVFWIERTPLLDNQGVGFVATSGVVIVENGVYLLGGHGLCRRAQHGPDQRDHRENSCYCRPQPASALRSCSYAPLLHTHVLSFLSTVRRASTTRHAFSVQD